MHNRVIFLQKLPGPLFLGSVLVWLVEMSDVQSLRLAPKGRHVGKKRVNETNDCLVEAKQGCASTRHMVITLAIVLPISCP